MDDNWEKRCAKCARCCYEKESFGGEIYYTSQPCEYLDLESRLCSVYERRHELRPGCAPLTPDVLKMGVLPSDCPYVSELQNYKAPCLAEEME